MMNENGNGSTEIVRADENVFNSVSAFENAQRMAKMLTASSLVPDTYKNNLPNAIIALEMAHRIGASPLAVMQNLYIVYGKPAWSSQFLISCVNASGKFSPMRYTVDGDGDERGCVAWVIDRSNERLESPRVTIGMAKAEGWYSKNGSKWKNMPELMLRYRAATLFARLYAPELTMGIQTDEEIIDITPIVSEPVAKKITSFEKALEQKEPATVEAAIIPESKPEDALKSKKTAKANIDPDSSKTLEEMLDGAPVSVQDIENCLRAEGKLGLTMSLAKNPTLEKMVKANINSMVSKVLNWKEAQSDLGGQK